MLDAAGLQIKHYDSAEVNVEIHMRICKKTMPYSGLVSSKL